MTSTANVSQELAVFLRSRRERLAPSEAGLPERGRQRRTPGLRREEVAELAGVSVDYVVRLEQGRLRPSAAALDALAGALRLSDDERGYLFDLARQRRPRDAACTEDVSPELAMLVADLSPLPAALIDHRFDILAWNREMTALMVDFLELPPHRRNMMWLCLLHPELREFWSDRERSIREGIADLRAAWAARPDDAALADLIAELTDGSEEFTRLWAQRDVAVNGRGHKPLRHPLVGDLTVAYEVLVPLQNPDLRLIIYRAADELSQRALDKLVAG